MKTLHKTMDETADGVENPIIILKNTDGLYAEMVVTDRRWLAIMDDNFTQQAVCAITACLDSANTKAGAMTVMLTDASHLKTLNSDYRGINKPTNVLAFMAEKNTDNYLGDIAMAYEVMMDEAESNAVLMVDHMLHLLVHGVLHLLGHSHEKESEARAMEALEITILGEIGVTNPYC